MKLIADWRQAWRYLSVQVSAAASAAVAAWIVLPDAQKGDLIALLPFDLGGKGPAVLTLLGFLGVIFARVKKQPKLDEPPSDARAEWTPPRPLPPTDGGNQPAESSGPVQQPPRQP